jgi:hypothetical protein
MYQAVLHMRSLGTLCIMPDLQMLRGRNQLYHSTRRRLEGLHKVNIPQEVLLQQREARKRARNAVIQARRRLKHIPDTIALFLEDTRSDLTTSLTKTFGDHFLGYVPPDFRSTTFAKTQQNGDQAGLGVTTLFPSAAQGVPTSMVIQVRDEGGTGLKCGRNVQECSARELSSMAVNTLGSLPRGQTTLNLLAQDRDHFRSFSHAAAKSAGPHSQTIAEPKVFTVLPQFIDRRNSTLDRALRIVHLSCLRRRALFWNTQRDINII